MCRRCGPHQPILAAVTVVPLRYTRQAQFSQLLPAAISLLIMPAVGGVTSVVRHEDTFAVGVLIGLVIWLLLWTPTLLIRRGSRYRIEGDTLLVRGLHRADIQLSSVRTAGPELWSPWTAGKKYQYLVLVIGSFRLRMGDPVARCYFQPEGLRALADGFEQSTDERVRENARWLRKLADVRDIEAWPLQPTTTTTRHRGDRSAALSSLFRIVGTPPYSARVHPDNVARFEPFRAEALQQGIPADEVERWIATARPCATLTDNGDGPVVGRFGGPAMVPPGTPDPWYPFVATIDLAAIPKEATDLPLPPDGHLLLFGFPDTNTPKGTVIHVPAGADVMELPKNEHFYADTPENQEYFRICQQYPQGPLHLITGVSLPANAMRTLSEDPWEQPLPGFPHSEELGDVWRDTGGDVSTGGPLRIGGFPSYSDYGGQGSVEAAASFAVEAEQAGRRPGIGNTSSRVEDWVLLAEWNPPHMTEREPGATVFWAIQHDDLAAGRFDRAYGAVDWNP